MSLNNKVVFFGKSNTFPYYFKHIFMYKGTFTPKFILACLIIQHQNIKYNISKLFTSTKHKLYQCLTPACK